MDIQDLQSKLQLLAPASANHLKYQCLEAAMADYQHKNQWQKIWMLIAGCLLLVSSIWSLYEDHKFSTSFSLFQQTARDDNDMKNIDIGYRAIIARAIIAKKYSFCHVSKNKLQNYYAQIDKYISH